VIELEDGLRLAILSLRDAIPQGLAPEFPVLLPAYTEEECAASLAKVAEAMRAGCGQIICIGPFAGKLHDLADEIIEDAERIDIGTMVIDEASTACYCLLEIVSDRGSRDRVAFIADHPEIAATMHDLITFGPTYD